MLPQCHQTVVCLAGQRFEVNVLDEVLSTQFSRKGYQQPYLVQPCWTLWIAVNLGSKLANHTQPARIRGYMDIETLDILVRAFPPVLRMRSNPVVVWYRGSAAVLSAHGAVYVVTIQPHSSPVQKFSCVEGIFWFDGASHVEIQVHSHPEGIARTVSIRYAE